MDTLYKEMLMNVKPSAVSQKQIDAFLKSGGVIKVLKSRKVVRHNLKSTSRGIYRAKV